MDNEIIKQQLEKLPKINNDNFFLKYKSTLSKKYAKLLIGKTIYFTWRRKSSNSNMFTKEYTSGKVLDYKDNKLLIYTHYVTILEKDLCDPNDLKDNEFIQEIPLENITDIAEFTKYEYEGWEILPDDYYGKIYDITNVQDNSIIALTYDFDGLYLHLAYKDKNNEVITNKYPISLISNMTPIFE
ncbi:MAG: hypothetical protein HFF38_13205 [Lawsonibacter sp.]|jgi:hypothetical protein|nr:hypothetical protein [Lawsonibacter sp.]